MILKNPCCLMDGFMNAHQSARAFSVEFWMLLACNKHNSNSYPEPFVSSCSPSSPRSFDEWSFDVYTVKSGRKCFELIAWISWIWYKNVYFVAYYMPVTDVSSPGSESMSPPTPLSTSPAVLNATTRNYFGISEPKIQTPVAAISNRAPLNNGTQVDTRRWFLFLVS